MRTSSPRPLLTALVLALGLTGCGTLTNLARPLGQAAAAYLSFATLLARQAELPMWAMVSGSTIHVAVGGSTKSAEGVTAEVLDLAEQLG